MTSPRADRCYFAVTQGTADWLQGKGGVIAALRDILIGSDDIRKPLQEFEFVEGPIHLAANSKLDLIALWNVDYLSGTGEEAWGFVKIDQAMGLATNPNISHEVLERCLHVINQRLQGLLLDGALIHRAHKNGTHTCLAGRGSEARQYSIGYVERVVQRSTSNVHAILIVGPEHDFSHLSRITEREAPYLDTLVANIGDLIAPKKKRAAATTNLFPSLRAHLASFAATPGEDEYSDVQVATPHGKVTALDSYRSYGLTFEDWLAPSSSLTDVQRRILSSNAIERHPLRIVGPGGSGKTLLMQLLALRQIAHAKELNRSIRVLYVVHNANMQGKVAQRFSVLAGHDTYLRPESDHFIHVTTLLEYGRNELRLDYTAVIDPDAQAAKLFQMEQVSNAITRAMSESPKTVRSSNLLRVVDEQKELLPVLALLIGNEISTVIKGHGLEGDERRYVRSERKLSRFHGVLNPDEREFVFNVFLRYHKSVFEEYEVLDTDDVALSLLGRLRTPMWELKRKKLGYDYVFVDETQLFNENERRIFPLLTNGITGHVPVVLALDQAQDIFGQATAGLATLGIRDIASESLASIHRSTRSIVQLAFFVIQRSTDLFGPDFPDFTSIAEKMEPDNHPFAMPPQLLVPERGSKGLGAIVSEKVKELRKQKLRQIAVICHAEQYWELLEAELRQQDLPLFVMLQRGDRLPVDQPVVALTRPAHAGGQEFDAVILVGLEQGVVPPRIANNEALSAAVEQQAIREMYLAITRARYRLYITMSPGAGPTAILREAEKARLLLRKAS